MCRVVPSSSSSRPAPTAPALPSQRPGSGQLLNLISIVLLHVGAVVAVARGATLKLVLLAAATYLVRMFAITAVYHRYFSHRSYRTSRVFQFLLALLGTTATQKGPLWWASTHRAHHRHSDTAQDVHSPLQRGFWYAHLGWWMGREHETTDLARVQDFARYPEILFLDRWHWIGPVLLMGGLALFGLDAFLWGYVLSTCVLLHATFTINSLAHLFGSRRYATTDTSRNNVLLALLTLGEGWHNNHHHYMSSARQGFFWWEIDVSYYILWGLARLGLVWDLRPVPEHVKQRHLLAEVGERSPLLTPAAARAPHDSPEEPAAVGAE